MRKSIITIVLAALVALVSTLGSAFAAPTSIVPATGAASTGNFILARDSRICLTPQPASMSVRTEGHADTPGLLFTVHRSTTLNGTYTLVPLLSSSVSVTDISGYVDQNSFPSLFPGYFKLCARNQSTTQGIYLKQLSIVTQ